MINEINVFAGYQFRSEFFNRSELDEAIAWACDVASSDLSKNYEISVNYKPVDITPGKILIDGLKSLVKASDICIFEASDLNNNVFIELGLAIAFEKPVIILLNKKALDQIKLPSDISGIVRCDYTDIRKLKSKLSYVLFEYSSRIVFAETANPYNNILKHFWLGHSQSDAIIIGGEVVQANSTSHVNDVYYVQSGDVSALVEASTNVALFNSNINIDVTSCSNIKGEDMTRNILAVGGPRSNIVSKSILKKLQLPWYFEYENIRGSKNKYITDRASSDKFEAVLSGDRILSDFCMIVSGANPFNPNSKFTLLAGLYTFGVLGAARAISPRISTSSVLNNVNAIYQRGWSGFEVIQIVAKVDVIEGKVITPLIKPKDINIIGYGKK